jgi:hypothetical protein
MLSPMAVDVRPDAGVNAPVDGELSPNAAGSAPIVTDNAPEATVLAPTAFKKSPVAIISSRLASDISLDQIGSVPNSAASRESFANSTTYALATDKYNEEHSNATTLKHCGDGFICLPRYLNIAESKKDAYIHHNLLHETASIDEAV